MGFSPSMSSAQEPPKTKSNLQYQNKIGPSIISVAENFLGQEYVWEGRGYGGKTGTMDCLGLVFRAYAKIFKENWVQYPVNPIDMVKSPYFGSPIPELQGVPYHKVFTPEKLQHLLPGDLIYFLIEDYDKTCAECFITEANGKRYGGWHTALSMGGDKIIHADPSSVVKKDKLQNISFDALYVSRRTQ